jgi:WD40 repeat protein
MSGTPRDEEAERQLEEAQAAVARMKKVTSMDHYSTLRSEREKATFTMMMKMNPLALTEIRKEFFAREDAISLDEFMFIINKHLVNEDGDDTFVMETPDQREFGANMFELFKDIDINGDGDLEWQEFTSFVVEKANLLNKRQKLASLPHYQDSTAMLDSSASYRHRNDINRIVNLPAINQFAMMEDNKRSIFLFNSSLGKHIATIPTDSAPIAMTPLDAGGKGNNLVVASFSDMTMGTYNFEGSISSRYEPTSTWATPGVQMALAYMPANQLLYSGATNGDVYSWRVRDRKMISTLAGHSDICMSLCILKKLNYLASASLDTTISVWDSYTNDRLLHLHGHKKGILDMSYSPEYRLLVSCGFEHDALVWSPFVKDLVYRLKGHHSALCGVKCVEGSPELITADVSGTFKLWDVRKFDCVQTFQANLSGTELKDDNSRLSCFEYCKLRSRNAMQKEDDSRIYVASKQVMSFDQERVVHAATSDKTTVHHVFWVAASVSFITVSDFNVIVWDALIGSKTVANDSMNGDVQITAACLDDRKRKMVVGDAHGHITVYNHLNGQKMKTSSGRRNNSAVISLVYICETIRFIAGYENGLIRVFDENPIEDCNVLRTFDPYKMHSELLTLRYDEELDTMLTAGTSDGYIRMWDYSVAKCEHEHLVAGPEDSVVYAAFLHPLPLVITSDSLCNIVLWGSRGSFFKTPGRIAGFMNQTPSDAELEPHIRVEGSEEPRPRRSLAATVPDHVLEAENVITAQPADDVYTHKNEPKNADALAESAQQAQDAIMEAQQKWGKSTSAQCIAWDPHSCTLFACDDLGVLRCYNIKKVIADIGMVEIADAAKYPGELDSHAHAEEKDKDGEGCGGDEASLGSLENPNKGLNDLLNDDDENGDNRGRRYIKGVARRLSRTARSALPPVPIVDGKGKVKRSTFAVSEPNDAFAYQGVDFCWALQAHGDRIASCVVTKQGCVTSGADLLVKMWTYDGLPLGVLLQSVPIGRRSQTWDLILDADRIIQGEDEELDEIIEEVKELANNPDKPDIHVMDFTAMEPGAGAEDFTRSELRQRIDETSNKLGIRFPTEGEEVVKMLGQYDPDDPDIGSVDSIGKAKTLGNALKELRSYRTASEYKAKGPDKGEMQKKMELKKHRQIARKFQKKGGMFVGPDTDSGVINHDIDNEEELIINPEDPTDAKPVHKEIKSDASLAESSVDFNDLDSLASSLGLPGTVKNVGENIATSIEQAAQKGRRTQTINKKCNGYKNWSALESALKNDPNASTRKFK